MIAKILAWICFLAFFAGAQASALMPSVSGPAVAKQTETEYLVRYQIGRFDVHHVFHGTDYDPTSYPTQGDCEIGLKKIKYLVLEKALQESHSNAAADDVLMRFKLAYACQELHLDPDAPLPGKAELPTPPASYQMTTVEGLPTTGAVITPNMAPTKTYRIVEFGRGPGYPAQIFYPASYASVPQCWEALNFMIETERNAPIALGQTQQDPTGYWYHQHLQIVEQHRKRLQCVSN